MHFIGFGCHPDADRAAARAMSEAAFAAVRDSSWEHAAVEFEAALMRAATRDNDETQLMRTARG